MNKLVLHALYVC